MSSETGKIGPALVKAWAEIPTVAHDRENPHFKNAYTTYDAIIQAVRPVLGHNGLALIQSPELVDGCAAVRTAIVHVSGESQDMGLCAVPVKKDNDPQAFGSAMTYAKRYGLCAALGIPTGDDDDANGAASGNDPRMAAYKAIAAWSGLGGSDLEQAAREVGKMCDRDPERIIAYVEQHKDEDFVEHMTKEQADA